MGNTTTIILADDHSLVRDGIRSLLEEEQDLKVIGEASDGQEALELVQKEQPDLLIIDIRMPRMTGIEAVEALKNNGVTTKAIILSMHDSEEYILKSVQAGASGYLLKDTGKMEFLKAIHTVREGGKYFSGDISNVLVNNLLNPSKESAHQEPAKESKMETPFNLTKKELKVLELVLTGLTNQQIAEQLQNSKRTIETHRFNLMRKMDVKNLMDLSRKAREHQLI